jgi:L-ribulose-5-phosphate 4-epimerase
VRHHGPFTWGPTPAKAVENAQVLEYVARMDLHARRLAPGAPRPDRHLVDRHYLRKHGGGAYYGQSK